MMTGGPRAFRSALDVFQRRNSGLTCGCPFSGTRGTRAATAVTCDVPAGRPSARAGRIGPPMGCQRRGTVMRNGTRLGLTCGRCGQPRELIGHVCVVRSGRAARRRATPKLRLDFGKCETCKRPVGNPLTHVCAPRSDFKAPPCRRQAREGPGPRQSQGQPQGREARVPELQRRRLQTLGLRGVQDRMARGIPDRVRRGIRRRIRGGQAGRVQRRVRRRSQIVPGTARRLTW